MTRSFDELSQDAFKRIFNKRRFLFIFSSLCCFGVVFSLLLKICVQWIPNLTFPVLGVVAFFPAFSILCASAVVVQAFLKGEQTGAVPSFLSALRDNWKALWLSLLVSMPFLMAMTLIGIVVVLSSCLNSLPWVGALFHTLFIFVPYLASISVILLFIGAFAALFFCAPVLISSDKVDYMQLVHSFKGNVLRQSSGLLIALAPLALSVWLAMDSFYLMHLVAQFSAVGSWLFLIETMILVIPVSLTLTPALSFFFNFSLDFYQDKEEASVV